MDVGTSCEMEDPVDSTAVLSFSSSRSREATSAACAESSAHDSLVMGMPLEPSSLTMSSMLSEDEHTVNVAMQVLGENFG